MLAFASLVAPAIPGCNAVASEGETPEGVTSEDPETSFVPSDESGAADEGKNDNPATTDVADEGASSSDTGGTTGEEDVCGLPPGSPPSLEIEGTRRVPIDVLAVSGQVTFDVASRSGTATAQMRFEMGLERGRPVFDLRQTITAVTLDGVALTPEDAGYFIPTGNDNSRMRSLDVELEPCTEHTLEVEYSFGTSDAFCSQFPTYGDDSVTWLDYANDLQPACFLEQWLPANLPHDELDIDLEIAVVGTDAAHAVISNGTVEPLGINRWLLEFPSRFTSMSPMMVVLPEANLEHQSTSVDLPDGHTLSLEIYKTRSYDVQMADLEAITAQALRDVNLELGDYIHGDRYTLFANEYRQDMEYDGATSTSLRAIEHEVFHSWVSRGLRPLTSRDGWLDEGWTTFSVDDEFGPSALTSEFDSPAVLAPDDLWVRATSVRSYGTGSRMWTNIADEIGLPELRGLLRAFYMQHAGEAVTTEQLEQYLFCETNAEVVRSIFHVYVYGRTDALPALPDGYCG